MIRATLNTPSGKYRKMPRELSRRTVAPRVAGCGKPSPKQAQVHRASGFPRGEQARAEGGELAAVLQFGADGAQRLQGAEGLINICCWQPPSQTIEALVAEPPASS